MTKEQLLEQRQRRVARTRAKIFGTADRPRLAIFRSNTYTSAQLIDDAAGKTIATFSSRELKKDKVKAKKSDQAGLVGEKIGAKALEKGVKQAVLDRRSYRYHGRVKAVADGARKAGLTI